jgi:molybdopterin/thiamine biosynthesis adenylyltransferase
LIAALSPDVDMTTHRTRLDRSTAAVRAGYDVDASDNFPTRYLVNGVCRLEGVLISHGAIYRSEGQVTTLHPAGPCYRCLFREASDPGTVPDCATTGVLGVLPGAVGRVQATEAVKLLLDSGDPLIGRLFFYDAMDVTFETVPYAPDAGCPVCVDDPIDSIDDVEYAAGCTVGAD